MNEDLTIGTNGNDNVYVGVTAVAGDFNLTDSTGAFALGANGTLTYTGPNIKVLSTCSNVIRKAGGAAGHVTLFASALDLNGDVLGTNTFSATALAGGQVNETMLEDFGANLVPIRLYNLTNGDVLRTAWAARFFAGGQANSELEGLTWSLVVVP